MRQGHKLAVTLALAIANGEAGHVDSPEAEEGPVAASGDGGAAAADSFAERISGSWIDAG